MAPEQKRAGAAAMAAELRLARRRGREEASNAMRAVAAVYDRAAGRVLLELANGCGFGFPPALVEGLERAGDDQLERVSIEGPGTALRWEDLDVDILVAPLLAGRFRHEDLDAGARATRRIGDVARQGSRGAGQWTEGRAAPEPIGH